MSRSLFGAALAALLTLLPSCGGVSEQRVKALEAQIQQIKEASAQGDVGAQLVAVQEKVSAIEKENSERSKRMEEMLEVLQREVSRVANEPETEKTPVGLDPWHDVDALLGVDGDGVKADGDKYTVESRWLVREIRALVLAGKGPTFEEGKKGGVTVKGVKPKAFLGQLGLKNNDVILAIGEREVGSPAELSVALRAAKSPVKVKLQRKKKELLYEYTLAN